MTMKLKDFSIDMNVKSEDAAYEPLKALLVFREPFDFVFREDGLELSLTCIVVSFEIVGDIGGEESADVKLRLYNKALCKGKELCRIQRK